nr:puromycin-sensitive aminopeptidase [Dugesia japonica]
MLRPIIIRTLGKCGYREVVDESFRRFNSHHEVSGDNNTGHVLSADIRSAVYSTVLKHGDETHLDKMMELLKRTDLHEERMRIMGSLGSVPFPMLHRIHKFAFSGEVRNQDKYRVLLSTVSNAESRSLFWNFMKSNWEEFKKQITNNHMLGIIIKMAFEDFVTDSRHTELHAFFNENPCAIMRPIEQTLENIKINEQHLARDGEKLKLFFSEY